MPVSTRHYMQRCLTIALCLASMSGLVACSETDASPSSPKAQTLYLGAGPGLSMMFAQAFMEQLQADALGLEIENGQGTPASIMGSMPLDIRSVADCCAAVSQWALASRELDMSIMCPVAAASLVADNKDYVLAGPVVLGGDVLVRRQDDVLAEKPAQSIGIAHLRVPQRRLVNATVPTAEVTELLPGALPYALERGVVDGVVVDVLVAQETPMKLCQMMPAESEYLQASQVLVVHRRVYDNPQFSELVRAMRRAALVCNEALAARQSMQMCDIVEKNSESGKIAVGEEGQPWTKTLTKFVSPLDFP